ncbi:MAG: hypothetical protein IPM29_18635 [Planctomycetes bacterium]|nr:hypothetical protein [Planctomycetota bacterium]
MLSGGDPLAGVGGPILSRGLVEATHCGDPAPTIRIAAFDDTVTIDGDRLHWLGFQSCHIATSGVVVRAERHCVSAGRIQVQAHGDITVLGNHVLHWGFPNPGTLSIEGRGHHSGGGEIDVRSLTGSVRAIDRAIDNVNHHNGAAVNRVYAHGDVLLATSGACNSSQPGSSRPPSLMAVIDASTVGLGEGGTNELRSFGGAVRLLTADTEIRASTWGSAGVPGANYVIGCAGVFNGGLVVPADPETWDDSGVCNPSEPPALFLTPVDLGVTWR